MILNNLFRIKNERRVAMCFSPSASFGASIVLAIVGTASLIYSCTIPQRVLAGIPIIFSIQQFVEGIVWLSLLHPSWARWQNGATFGFLVFAQMVWPVYVPLSMLLFETNPKKKKIIRLLAIFGFLFSAYIGFCLYQYPVLAVIDGHHIRYDLGFALSKQWYYGLLYFLPTILTPIISSVKRLHWLGYLFLASYILARVLFRFFVISVWCFFGAVISIVIFGMIFKFNKRLPVFPRT
jgi:hypothetical protein